MFDPVYILDYTLDKGSSTFEAVNLLKRLQIIIKRTPDNLILYLMVAREAACAASWHCKMSYSLKSRAELCGLLNAQKLV